MKQLILLRHAKSSWDESSLSDFDRPLAARGEHDAPRMAERLAARGAVPTLLLASPAARALRTAELVAEVLRVPPANIHTHADLYLASPRTLLTVVAAQTSAHSRMLLVAHNPGLTELVNELLPALGLDNLPTAGIVAIDGAARDWALFARAEHRLAFYDYPKNPERIT